MTCNYPELGSASDWILIDITNQKHYPDLVSDASSVSFLRRHFAGIPVVTSRNVCSLLGLRSSRNLGVLFYLRNYSSLRPSTKHKSITRSSHICGKSVCRRVCRKAKSFQRRNEAFHGCFGHQNEIKFHGTRKR